MLLFVLVLIEYLIFMMEDNFVVIGRICLGNINGICNEYILLLNIIDWNYVILIFNFVLFFICKEVCEYYFICSLFE